MTSYANAANAASLSRPVNSTPGAPGYAIPPQYSRAPLGPWMPLGPNSGVASAPPSSPGYATYPPGGNPLMAAEALAGVQGDSQMWLGASGGYGLQGMGMDPDDAAAAAAGMQQRGWAVSGPMYTGLSSR